VGVEEGREEVEEGRGEVEEGREEVEEGRGEVVCAGDEVKAGSGLGSSVYSNSSNGCSFKT
jgi:hypothetical protein